LLFTGGYDKLHEVVASIRKKQKERKIVVEAHTIEEAKRVAASGAHVVQMDKLSPSDFTRCKTECRELNSGIIVIAAGGINRANAAEYAESGSGCAGDIVDVFCSSGGYSGIYRESMK
jgi:molybdenum transport protein